MDLNPCPWCAHTEFRFNDNGTVGCKRCDAYIPVNAEWYKEGRTIVEPGNSVYDRFK